MKKWKQIFLFAVAAMAITFISKTESQAAQMEGLSQTDDSTDSVTFSWNADLNADTYYVDISSDNETWVTQKDSTSSTYITLDGLTAGATYYVRVTGYSGGSVISTTSESLAVVTAPIVSNMTVIQSGATKTGVKLTYSNVSGANYYYADVNNEVIGTSDSSTLSTSKTLVAGTSYWVHAWAARKSASGYVALQSSYSYESLYVKTLSPKITKKNFGVSYAWSSINSYQFAISDSHSVDGYQFQFLTMKGKVKKTVTSSSSSCYVNDFINGAFYKYRVRSYVTCGSGKSCSAWSTYRYIGLSKKFSGNATKKRIKASWSKVSSASNYIVSISTSENGKYKKVKTLSSKKRSITITKYGKKKLKKGKTYYVRVAAKTKSGKKKVSSDVNWRGNVTIPSA